jgi:hypothetical protein
MILITNVALLRGSYLSILTVTKVSMNVVVLLRAFFPHDLGPANQLIAATRIYPLVNGNGATPMNSQGDGLFCYFETPKGPSFDQTWKPSDLKKIGG